MGTASHMLKNNPPSSASAVDDKTGFIMLLLVWMGPLLGGSGSVESG